MPVQVLELESLLVKIIADATSFLDASKDVEAAIKQTEASLVKFSRTTTRVVNGAFANLNASLSGIADMMRSIDFSQTTKAVAPIAAISRAFKTIAAADMAKVMANLQQFTAWIGSINAMVGPEAVATFNKLGRAAFNLGSFLRVTGAGAATLTANANSLVISTTAAAPAVKGMTTGLTRLAQASMAADLSLTALRFTIAGLAAFGVAAFARFDDSLTRTLARMGDWSSGLRSYVERATLDFASRSVFGLSSINRTLGDLAASGMNASLAIRALGVSENFALAANLDIVQATRRLVEIQASLRESSLDVEDHMAYMNRLSDVFVRLSMLTNSTVEQVADAFGARFVAALRITNLSLEQGAAMIGAYAQAQIHSGDASNRAALFLQAITHANLGHAETWRRLGIQVFDTAGNMRQIPDILQQLELALGNVSVETRLAKLEAAGFNNMTARSILPLIGMSRSIRELTQEMNAAGGTTKLFADMIRRDFMSQLKILWSNVTVLAVTVGTALAPALSFLNDVLKSLLGWFNQLNPAIKAFVVWSAVAYFAALPLIRLFASLAVGAWTAVSGTFRFLGRGVMYLIGLFQLLGGTVISSIGYVGSFVKQVATSITRITLSLIHFLASVNVSVFRTMFSLLVLILKVATVVVALIAFNVTSAIVSATQKFLAFINVLTVDTLVAGFKLLVKTAISAASHIGDFISSVVKSLYNLLPSAASVLKFIANTLYSLLTGLLSLLVNAFAWIAALSVLVTAAVGLFQLWKVVLASIPAIFNAIKSAVVGLFSWIDGQVGGIGNRLSSIWDGFKRGARAFVDDAAEFFTRIIGFFWNWQQNAVIIFTWLRYNWRNLLIDITNGFFLFLENMRHNLMVLGGFVSKAGVIGWDAFWNIAKTYAGVFFHWFSQNWTDIIHDIGVLFGAFFKGVINNFIVIAKVVGELLAEAINAGLSRTPENIGRWIETRLAQAIVVMTRPIQVATGAGTARQELSELNRMLQEAAPNSPMQRILQTILSTRFQGIDVRREDLRFFNRFIPAEAVSEGLDLQGLLRDLVRYSKPVQQFGARGTLLGVFGAISHLAETSSQFLERMRAAQQPTTMAGANVAAVDIMNSTVNSFVQGFRGDLSELQGAFHGFVSSMRDSLQGASAAVGIAMGSELAQRGFDLRLLTGLPNDAWERLQERMLRLLRPDRSEGMPEIPGLTGRQGPGFTFREMALNRFEFGGPVNARLDFQQLEVLRSMDRRLSQLVNAANRRPAEGIPAMPVEMERIPMMPVVGE